MSETAMQSQGAKTTHKYTITLEGVGGEYACIPVSQAQAAYWREQGNAALAAHISLKGQDDESVPSEFQLPDFREQNFLCGVDPSEGVKLTVEDQDGNCCVLVDSDDDDFRERMNFARKVGPLDGPPKQPVVMYRTVLKGADVYELETSEEFDLERLSLECAAIARFGDLIHSARYDGGEVEFVDGVDREKQPPVAVLVSA